MSITRVCVYCASSRQCDQVYHDSAARLGAILAREGVTIVYGGGKSGSMGALADGALSAGGRVIGVLPRFMDEVEWGHKGLSELILVNSMHERKRLMIQEVDAVVALPGACGTWEELFEAMSFKRLGLFVGAIVIVNTNGYYTPMLEMLERSVEYRFMDERHRAMWTVIEHPEEVLDAIRNAPPWSASNRSFAAI
ncbi:MAG TPA: TIGR00730 family Rossman fold protein [Candidatus Binataceae bacterium]|nr:TIGR00730 family Rossman fold protein [Candidatus Binataceae bacterium]